MKTDNKYNISRRFIIIMCFSLAALFCYSQESKYILMNDIVYLKDDTLKADFYLPVNYERQKNPVLIFIDGYGGDYRKWDHYTSWAKFAATDGFVSIIYSSRENYTNESFESILNFLSDTGDKYYVDLNRISVYAGSGNVLRALPIANGDPRVKAALMFYGTAKIEKFRLDMPVLLVRAGLDNVQLNKELDSLAFKALMANAPYTITNFNTAFHAFEDFSDNEISVPFLKSTLDFLKNNLQSITQKNFSVHREEVIAVKELYNSNWQAAFDAYKQVLNKNSGNNEAERQLGNICIAMKAYEKALSYYDSALIHGNWRKGEIAIKKLYAYAKLNNAGAAVAEMRSLRKIGWFKEEDYAGNREYAHIVQSAICKEFRNEK
jgi:Dienelactone hydrolase family